MFLPVRGVDQGVPFNQQPEGTCPDCLNVRALDLRDRTCVGKRSGHSKAFTNQIGNAAIANGRRVHHLAGYAQGGQTPSAGGGTVEIVEEDFTGVGGGFPNNPSSYLMSVEIAANAGVTTGPTNLNADWGADSALGTAYLGTEGGTLANDPYILFFPRWGTTNEVTVRYALTDDQNTSATATIDAGCMNLAVVCRANNLLTTFCIARLVRVTATTFQLRISTENAGTLTTLITSAVTLTVNNTGVATDDLVMTISDDGTTVTATASWASQGGYNDSISTSSVSLPSALNNRAGFGRLQGSTGTGANPTFAAARFFYVKSYSLSILRPSTAPVILSMVGTDEEGGTSRYLVPTGFRTAFVDASPFAVESITSGPDSATGVGPADTFLGSGQLSEEPPVIDQTGDVLHFETEADGTNFSFAFCEDNPTSRLGMATRFMDTVTTTERMMGFCTRVSADGQTGIFLKTEGSAPPIDKNVDLATVRTIFFAYVRAGAVVLGNGIGDLAFDVTPGGGVNQNIVVHSQDQLLFIDNGTTIEFRVNGMSMFTYTLNATELATGAYTSNRTGACAPRNTGTDQQSYGFQLVQVSDTTGINLGDSSSTVAAFTRRRVYTGNLATGAFTQLIGIGLDNPLVSTAILFGKIYAVDGDDSKIVDPAALTVTNWVATKGTLPAMCRLACTYRGRIVLGRPPDNASMYFMSRVGDALDWDYGAAPDETSAIFGGNADVGQPADTLTCLIPYSDDWLLFGCASSIWFMDGDPGYGGQVQNASYQTGIVGPRAFCFDEDANLYFLGQGGLFKMDRGTLLPRNIAGRRLDRLLGNTDFDTTLVQLMYNTSKATVSVFFTPTDGVTAGVHVVYDVHQDALFLDQYPADFGPWSVMQTVGVEERDRQYIIGGNDGYVRRPDDATNDDDGIAVESWVRLAPYEAPMGVVETMLVEMHAEGAVGNGALTWYWVINESAEEIGSTSFANAIATAVSTGTWFSANAGFQVVNRFRQRAPAHQLILFQETLGAQWSMERILTFFGPAGRRRSS